MPRGLPPSPTERVFGALVVGERPGERYAADERALLFHVAHEIGAALFALRAQALEARVREAEAQARESQAMVRESEVRARESDAKAQASEAMLNEVRAQARASETLLSRLLPAAGSTARP